MAKIYLYVARDKDGELMAFATKPERGTCCWLADDDGVSIYDDDDLDFIDWDDEPAEFTFSLELEDKDKEIGTLYRKIDYLEDQLEKARQTVDNETGKRFNEALKWQPGDKVKMIGCAEADLEEYKDKVWTIARGAQFVCGDLCVWLEGFGGAFNALYLKKVDDTQK